MYKFIWMSVWLFNGLVVYANEKNNGVSLVEDSDTRQQLGLIHQNQYQGGGANIATIGSDANCTYQAGMGVIQTAIADGFNEIRLVKGTHMGNIEIFDQNLNVKGRYLNCLLALNDVPSNFVADNSVISSISGAALPAVRISGDSQRNIVLFKNLTISNGEVTTASVITGGGIDVRQADVALTLDTVQITNNQGSLGGGLAVSGSAINVDMIDSLVFANTAQEGGGIHCFGNGATINMRDTGPENPSGVGLNNATNGNGGGLYIWGNCGFSSTSGSYGQGGLDLNGIVLNSATGDGGGVYVSSGGQVTLDGSRICGLNFCTGTNDSNVRVSANTADSDDDNDGSGGGIYVTGQQTSANLINAVIADNTAIHGGGLSATNKAEIYMSSYYTDERSLVRCWSPGSCSQITGNQAESLGGGVEARTGSYVNLDRTVIKQNRANNATALYVRSEPGSNDISVVDLVGSLVVNNGAGSSGGFADINVITLTGGQAFIKYTTFADNDVQGTVIGSGANGLLNIRSSIIHQLDGVPTYLAFNPHNSSLVGCLMVSTLDDFSGFNSPLLSVDDPEFTDRLAEDFHLTDNSPAIDYCGAFTAGNPSQDLEPDVRGWDDPAVPNSTTANPTGQGITYDLGYDENFRLIADLIFRDGFEQ